MKAHTSLPFQILRNSQPSGVYYTDWDRRPAGVANRHTDLDCEHVHRIRIQRVPVTISRGTLHEVDFHAERNDNV